MDAPENFILHVNCQAWKSRASLRSSVSVREQQQELGSDSETDIFL